MEISHSELKFSYKIAPKADGTGFVATPSDASMASLEGATQEEVQQKVRAAIGALIAERLPNLQSQIGSALAGSSELKFGNNVKVNTKTNVFFKVNKPNGEVIQMPSPSAPAEISSSSSTAFDEPAPRTGDAWGISAFVKVLIAAVVIFILYLYSRR